MSIDVIRPMTWKFPRLRARFKSISNLKMPVLQHKKTDEQLHLDHIEQYAKRIEAVESIHFKSLKPDMSAYWMKVLKELEYGQKLVGWQVGRDREAKLKDL